MKKFAFVTFGLLLAASPAFATTSVDQDTVGNSIANTTGNSASSAGNGGVANTDISNSSGIINENVNTGASSNVGSATDVVVTGGVSVSGSTVNAGNVADKNSSLSAAYLNQVSVGNKVGDAANCAQSSTYTPGVANVGVNGSYGIVSQQINVGAASNVGSATGITIH
jgi:hypothetical protein